jgi:hypothetical protein
MVSVHINEAGNLDESSPIVEYFYTENAPTATGNALPDEATRPDLVRDQLF